MSGVNDAVRRNAFLASVIGWWREQRSLGRAGDWNDQDHAHLVRIAAELGVTRRDIELLAAEGAYADRLMERMLGAHNIALLDLAASRPELADTIALRCFDCTEKNRCRQELDAGTAAAHAADFCPNATMIRSLAS